MREIKYATLHRIPALHLGLDEREFLNSTNKPWYPMHVRFVRGAGWQFSSNVRTYNHSEVAEGRKES